MNILFDQGTPVPLRSALAAHAVSTAFELGWARLDDATLLRAAEARFDLFITTDKNMRFQQNLSGRLSVLILPTPAWPVLRRHLPAILRHIEAVTPGTFHAFVLPRDG